MNFHESDLKDLRRRFYIPAARIIHSADVTDPDILTGNLEIQPFMFGLRPYAKCVLAPGGNLLIDFGKALHGGIRIVSAGTASPVIRVRFGESVSEAMQTSNQDHSRKEDTVRLPNGYGMTEYGNTVFRFVQLFNAGDSEIWLTNVTAVALEQDLEVTGSFESSDPRLDLIWKTAVRTVHLCMQDYLYDGGKRDRIVWAGDMHPEIHGILCAFSDTSIIRRSFEFLMQRYQPDQPINNIFSYNCWVLIGLWDYYCVSMDKGLLEQYRTFIRAMAENLAVFVGPDGSEQIPERRFLDWPDDDDPAAKHAGLQALLLWSMKSASGLFGELGLPADRLTQAADLLRCHIPDPAGRKAPAALQTLTGLADRTGILEHEPFKDVSTFYGYYILQAKKTIPALELIRKYWGAMLDFGATSFWEDFDLDWTKNASRIDELPVPGKADLHADFGAYCYRGLRHSLSHGWSCGPAPFLSSRVLGITFPAPGKVHFEPDLGDLKFASGTVPTPFGLIRVEAEKGKKAKLELPQGLQLI